MARDVRSNSRRSLVQFPVRKVYHLCYCLLRVLNPYRDLGRSENSDPVTKNRSPSFILSSLPKDSPHARILRLLRVLCQFNTIEAEHVAFVSEDDSAIGGTHDSR